GIDPLAMLFGAFSGLPQDVKTKETGQRLANSRLPIVSALGMHFINLAKNGHYLSVDSDLKQFFGPSMKFTTSCLYGYEPTPINQAMQDVVFKGYHVLEIKNHYAKSN